MIRRHDEQEEEQKNDLGADAAEGDNGMATSADPSATARHTPGPWFLVTAAGRIPAIREVKKPHGEASHYRAVLSTNDVGGGHTIANLDFGYGSSSDAANAEFIVRACNSHDELLEALKRLWLDAKEAADWSVEYAAEIDAAIEKAKGL